MIWKIQDISIRLRVLALVSAPTGGTVLLLGGCASLDPAANMQAASTLVADRSEHNTNWDAPWNEPSTMWNGGMPLSSDVAVGVALQNNRAIRRQVEQIVAARAEYVQAHLLPNPVVNVAIGFPTDGMGGEPLTVSLVQQLAALWRRPDAIDEAEAQLHATILSVSDEALRLVASVRQTHAAVVYAEQAVAIQRENIELLGQAVELLDARLSVGEASQLDVNRTALDLHVAQVLLEDRSATLQRIKRELLALLGRADASTTWTTNGIVSFENVFANETDEQRYIELAQMQRLDVAAALATVDARAAAVQFQETGRFPDVRGGMGYQQNFSSRSGVFPSAAMTVPIFDDNSARITTAESQYRQSIIEADRVLQNAVAETRSAWINARSQWRVISSFEQDIVALAESNHLLAQDAFNAGESDLTVLLEAQRQLNDLRLELSDRRAAAATYFIELERAVGGSFKQQSSPTSITGFESERIDSQTWQQEEPQ